MFSIWHLWLTYVHHISPIFIICHPHSLYVTSDEMISPRVTCIHYISHIFTTHNLLLTYVHHISFIFIICHIWSPCVILYRDVHHMSPMFIIYHIYSHMSISFIYLQYMITYLQHMSSPVNTCSPLFTCVDNIPPMYTIVHLWLQYGLHMSSLCSLYVICVWDMCHLWPNIFFACDMPTSCILSSLYVTYVHHMSSLADICLAYVTYVHKR